MDDAMTKDVIDGTREVMQELTAAVRDLLEVVKERELHPAGLVSGMEVRQAIISLTNELQKQAEWAYRNRAASAVANELEALRRRVEEMDQRLGDALSRTMKTTAEHETALRKLGAIQWPPMGATSGGG